MRGDDQPRLAPQLGEGVKIGATPAGKAKNRRIELKVTS